jgi:hypothetical protein
MEIPLSPLCVAFANPVADHRAITAASPNIYQKVPDDIQIRWCLTPAISGEAQ